MAGPEHQLFHVSLKVVITNDRGETLLLRGQPDGTLEGHYDLPGGRVDDHEVGMPLPKIVARELREELGAAIRYELTATQPVSMGWHRYPYRLKGCDHWVLFLFFTARYCSGEIVISDEHVGFDWVRVTADTLEQLFTRGILEGMRGYIKLVDPSI